MMVERWGELAAVTVIHVPRLDAIRALTVMTLINRLFHHAAFGRDIETSVCSVLVVMLRTRSTMVLSPYC